MSALAPWIGPLLSCAASIFVAWWVFRRQSKKEQEQWLRDQKKAEWRELLSAISACRGSWVLFSVLDKQKPSLVGGIKGSEVFLQVKQMIHDRLFIDEQCMAVVRRERLEMLDDANLPTDEQTEASFQYFIDSMLNLSKEDLNI